MSASEMGQQGGRGRQARETLTAAEGGAGVRAAGGSAGALGGLHARLALPRLRLAWLIDLMLVLLVAGIVNVMLVEPFRLLAFALLLASYGITAWVGGRTLGGAVLNLGSRRVRSGVMARSRSGSVPSQRRRRIGGISWGRQAIVELTVIALFAGTGCSIMLDPSPEGPRLISYAGAASQLDGLEPLDAEEQLRDWARTGLASLLEFDTAQLRDAAYDTVPVRDPAFTDLAEQPPGPGRSLYDGRGVLHVLVPRGDPYESRTIGLLIDDFRADTGADPEQVAIHHYQILPERLGIELTSGKPAPTADARAAHGYVEMRVDATDRLIDFLTQTQHLALLEVRGSEIWAGGWHWPGVPGTQLSFEDVSVLQRGYRKAPSDPTPGFSLDPVPPETIDDLRAVLPDVRPELIDRLITGDWQGSPFTSTDEFAQVVDYGLSDDPQSADLLPALGLPTDRTQLWALKARLNGRPLYSQARYEGRLEGTEVGMTLFYTDHIAKSWTTGVGTGVPADAVKGFVPDPAALIPWSHCRGPEESLSESGRLWFGQDDSGFAFSDDGVSIGASATRLFARSEGDEGTEVEPSFGFGRGLRWWDQHYLAVADYEPQYHRLDQIMRWSGALEWLASQGGPVLPQLDDGAIRSDLRFQDWYAANNGLRERSPIAFVAPPSATQEAILARPSKTFASCGFLTVSGGVSTGDLIQRKGSRSFEADLPAHVRRGGLLDETSAFDPAAGTGRITQHSIDDTGQVVDSLERTFSMSTGGRSVIDVVGGGRRVASFGDLKVWRAHTAPRKLTTEIAAGAGRVSHGIRFQDLDQGQLTASKVNASTTTVQWRPGPGDRLHRALESIQDRLASGRAGEPPEPTDGVLFGYDDGTGRRLYEIGDKDRQLSITKELSPPGEEVVLRLGAPNPETGLPEFYSARLVPRSDPPGPWIEVTPAVPGSPARWGGAAAPGPHTRTVRVETADGRASEITVSQAGDRWWAPSDDPILGWSGSPEGTALLGDFPKIEAAMRAAATAQRGLAHAVTLGDGGVAFASPDKVVIAPTGHPWVERARRAVDPANPDRAPPFVIEDGQAFHVELGALTAPGPARRVRLGEVLDTHDLYVREDLRAQLTLEEGMLLPDAVPRRLEVVVREATPSEGTGSGRSASRPDVHVDQNWRWVLANGSTVGGLGLQQALLVCPPQEGTDTAECEE